MRLGSLERQAPFDNLKITKEGEIIDSYTGTRKRKMNNGNFKKMKFIEKLYIL